MTSSVYTEESLDDMLNARPFARLHSPITNAMDLANHFNKFLSIFNKICYPYQYNSIIAQYINLIDSEAFQLHSKIIFVLKKPLVEPEIDTYYRLYANPIYDN